MPNRRAHDHIGQIRNKIRKRIEIDSTKQVIANLEKLADANANLTESDIDKIVTKLIDDPKFLAQFIKNYKSAVKTLKISVK